MKPLIPILVVATTSLAVASVQFARQASSERQRADTEMQLRQKHEARVAELERNQAQLQGELAAARAQPQAAPPVVATATPPPRPAPGSRATGPAIIGGVAAANGAPPPPPFEMRGRGMMDSPAGRNFMRSRVKNQVRRLYGDAGQALGLSAEKSNQLMDLLADQQSRSLLRVPNELPEGVTLKQYFDSQQAKNQDEIKALIGADKMQEWAAYQKSLPMRSEVGVMRDQLEQAGFPMTDSQRTEMLTAITEEQQRLPRPAFAQGVPTEETISQMNQWQTEYEKVMNDRAKQILTADQYSAYKEFQDWQTEMRNSLPRGPNGAPGGVVMRSFNAVPGLAVPPGAAVTTFSMPAPPPPERK